ncbi:hypothetical protein SAMN04487894_11288 [Niabella drilacis]|uniref:Uncharacterized protein n=1 Tax=Niabella drilacis (strain DSM 25811 / CCM 8410 / CCUG 62505 / LMG 26954 / E90) TaxID=1285928 RepID=A0A1G6X028_NIADE|nr:hypothetical protein SAMN04487894_11288 [Niabella drilacis]
MASLFLLQLIVVTAIKAARSRAIPAAFLLLRDPGNVKAKAIHFLHLEVDTMKQIIYTGDKDLEDQLTKVLGAIYRTS